MKNKKYVCPKCGGKLFVTHEHLFEKRQSINPATGKLNKTVKRHHIDSLDTLTGIGCENCTFEYYGNDNNILNELLDKIKHDENFKILESDSGYFKK